MAKERGDVNLYDVAVNFDISGSAATAVLGNIMQDITYIETQLESIGREITTTVSMAFQPFMAASEVVSSHFRNILNYARDITPNIQMQLGVQEQIAAQADDLAGMWDIIPQQFEKAVSSIMSKVPRFGTDMGEGFKTSLSSLIQVFTEPFDGITDLLDEIIKKAKKSGIDIFNFFGQGIKQGWPKFDKLFKTFLQKIDDFFPHSKPKNSASPLVKIFDAGLGFLEWFAAGITSGGGIIFKSVDYIFDMFMMGFDAFKVAIDEVGAAPIRQFNVALKSTWEASERFALANYRLYGSMQGLSTRAFQTSQRFRLVGTTAEEAFTALMDVGSANADLEKLAGTIGQVHMTTGLAVGELAEYTRSLRLMGFDTDRSVGELNRLSSAMRSFGLTSRDAGLVLQSLNSQAAGLSLIFGPERVKGITDFAIAMGAMARATGTDVKTGIDLATKSLIDFNFNRMVAAQNGKLLATSEAEAFENLVGLGNKWNDALEDAGDEFGKMRVRAQIMQQLGVTDEQIASITKMSEKVKEMNLDMSDPRAVAKFQAKMKAMTTMSTGDQYQERMGNLLRSWQEFNSLLERTWQRMLIKLEPALVIVMKLLSGVVAALDPIIALFEAVMDLINPVLKLAWEIIGPIFDYLVLSFRSISVYIQGIGVMLKAVLMPIIYAIKINLAPIIYLFKAMNAVFGAFIDAAQKGLSKLSGFIDAVFAPIDAIFSLLDKGVQYLGEFAGWLAEMWDSTISEAIWEAVGEPWQEVCTAFDELYTDAIKPLWDEFTKALHEVGVALGWVSEDGNLMKDIFKAIGGVVKAALYPITWVLKLIVTGIKAVKDWLLDIDKVELFKGVKAGLLSIASGFSWLADGFSWFTSMVINTVEGALYWLNPVNIYNRAVAWFDALLAGLRAQFPLLDAAMNFAEWAYNAGVGLWDAFTGGLTAGIGAVTGAIGSAFDWVRSFFPGSDAERGPLSDITASGKAMLTTFTKGISTGIPALDKAIEGVSGMMGGLLDIPEIDQAVGSAMKAMGGMLDFIPGFGNIDKLVAEATSTPISLGVDSMQLPQQQLVHTMGEIPDINVKAPEVLDAETISTVQVRNQESGSKDKPPKTTLDDVVSVLRGVQSGLESSKSDAAAEIVQLLKQFLPAIADNNSGPNLLMNKWGAA